MTVHVFFSAGMCINCIVLDINDQIINYETENVNCRGEGNISFTLELLAKTVTDKNYMFFI